MPREPTRLSRALREPAPARPTPLELFALARRSWLAGERVDIGALAARLGIGRATAFRWVGSREALLGEILWSLCEALLADCAQVAGGLSGPARIGAICGQAVRAIVDFRPLRQFVRQDPEFALKLLTSKLGPVQGRSIAAVRSLLQAEAEGGAWTPALSVDTLAYLIVRVCESFIYARVISDQAPDVGEAALAVELLLSGRVAGTGHGARGTGHGSSGAVRPREVDPDSS